MINIIFISILLFITITLIYLTIKFAVINLTNKIKKRLNREVSLYDKLLDDRNISMFEEVKKIDDQIDLKVIEDTKYILLKQDSIDYVDENFNEKYKIIKKKYSNIKEEFSFIKEFVSKKDTKSTKEYFLLEEILEYFSGEKMLSLYFLEEEKQKEIVSNIIKSNEIFNDYMIEEKFDILDFIEFVKIKKIEYDNNIYLFGTKEYSNLEMENLIYIFDEKIIEGYNLKYKNKIYKYSFE